MALPSETRNLGIEGPAVHPIGLGAMGMSGTSYGPADEGEAVRAINAALDLGVSHIDTADVYGHDGHNERLVGRAIAGRRDEVVVATKFGFIGSGTDLRVDGRPERVRPCVEASLARLGIDAIDLMYLHRVDPDVAVEETVGEMARLVDAGLIRHLGLSEAGVDDIRRAHATHPIAAVQSEYSLWWRHPEERLIPALRELGICLVAFSPIGRGLLGGSLTSATDIGEGDLRRNLPRFQGANLAANLALGERVRSVATTLGVTPGQLALAWLLQRDDLVLAIPGMRTAERVRENAAATAVELTADALAELDAAFPIDAGVGERYPEHLERYIGR